jgi:hypothetical protein
VGKLAAGKEGPGDPRQEPAVARTARNRLFRNGGFPLPTAPDNPWQQNQAFAKTSCPCAALIRQPANPGLMHAHRRYRPGELAGG